MTTFGIAIMTYNGVDRTRFLLESIKRYDPDTFNYKFIVSEDPSTPEVHERYVDLCNKYGVELHTRKTWGFCQGNWRHGFDKCDTDIIIGMSDDILVPRNAIKAMIYFWENNPELMKKVGAVRIPEYDKGSLHLVGISEDKFYNDPFNTWFDGDKLPPRLHLPWICHMVHGTGFMIDRKLYYRVGPFSPKYYSFDEDISAKIWLKSDRIICQISGPAVVHCAGRAIDQSRDDSKRFTGEGFDTHIDQAAAMKEEYGVPKKDLIWRKIDPIMEKNKHINEELKKANYFGDYFP